MSLIRKQVDTCAQKRLSIDHATHLVLGTGALGILSSQHNPHIYLSSSFGTGEVKFEFLSICNPGELAVSTNDQRWIIEHQVCCV